MARAGVALRKFGQEIIQGLAQERVHPSWIVPGGVNAPLSIEVRDRILAGLPAARALGERTIAFFKTVVDQFAEEIANFGSDPTMYAGLVDRSEEHTSELQSLRHLVCRLLLEKKKKH